MTRVTVLAGLDPATHRAHPLHAPERLWSEKNCYTDLWIELLHALGMDPTAMLPFVLGVDFQGDQWTFFKPPSSDLRRLYGIEVQELTVWRPLLDHALEHLGAGRWLAVEVDAFWLPDTVGTDYRQAHAKTTVVLNHLDTAARCLGYFHNAGYFMLDGEDFDALFGPTPLPPFAEFIAVHPHGSDAPMSLRTLSRSLCAEHLAWRPRANPVRRFGERLARDLPLLQEAGMPTYHRWAFAGIRQLGAAAELAALYLGWLHPDAPPGVAITAFGQLALNSKALLLKTARAVHSGRTLDAGTLLEAMAADWEAAIEDLAGRAETEALEFLSRRVADSLRAGTREFRSGQA